jgi:uncharacterized membrane protein HdeD (DUF308 family)
MSPLGAIPLIACALFLTVSAVFHFMAPQRVEHLLAQIKPVRLTGVCLVLLGGWCLHYPSLGTILVGVPVLLSGIARLVVPRRMVQVNRWASRFTHGLLMLCGALGCLLMAYYFA